MHFNVMINFSALLCFVFVKVYILVMSESVCVAYCLLHFFKLPAVVHLSTLLLICYLVYGMYVVLATLPSSRLNHVLHYKYWLECLRSA